MKASRRPRFGRLEPFGSSATGGQVGLKSPRAKVSGEECFEI